MVGIHHKPFGYSNVYVFRSAFVLVKRYLLYAVFRISDGYKLFPDFRTRLLHFLYRRNRHACRVFLLRKRFLQFILLFIYALLVHIFAFNDFRFFRLHGLFNFLVYGNIPFHFPHIFGFFFVVFILSLFLLFVAAFSFCVSELLGYRSLKASTPNSSSFKKLVYPALQIVFLIPIVFRSPVFVKSRYHFPFIVYASYRFISSFCFIYNIAEQIYRYVLLAHFLSHRSRQIACSEINLLVHRARRSAGNPSAYHVLTVQRFVP